MKFHAKSNVSLQESWAFAYRRVLYLSDVYSGNKMQRITRFVEETMRYYVIAASALNQICQTANTRVSASYIEQTYDVIDFSFPLFAGMHE
eukprot:757231-Hanusia_phi.AAC.2